MWLWLKLRIVVYLSNDN